MSIYTATTSKNHRSSQPFCIHFAHLGTVEQAQEYFENTIVPYLPAKLALLFAYFSVDKCTSVKPSEMILCTDENDELYTPTLDELIHTIMP